MPAALISRDDALARIAEVFRSRGYEGASLSALSAASGLGKGSLYHYFPGGKEQMAAEVLAHIDAWFEAAIYAPLHSAQDAPAAIAAMFGATERYFHGGGRVCLMGAFALDATRDRFAAALQSYFARWVAALAAALRRAGMQQAQSQAEAVVAGIQGALTLARALDDAALFRRRLHEMQQDLLAGLA
ncbi:TetR family transcriptional regulator [Ferrovibrio sp.]|uniref:TetR family transcriptional regulator n=1 Tax=Ferrovibrio sp. TaxID=1917215 RepID=UPI001B7CC7C1|nr:TetR family transcriptional regulator [Ferrovibrio sp.]MBP7062598.1 TetR family transcriptional regulator [Ferrovibrio sp.]